VPQLALSLDLDGLDAEAVEAAFMEAGALSVTYTDRRDDPILEPAPGEFRLWPASRLQALFDPACVDPAMIQSLCAALGIAAERITAEQIADRAWEREWLKDFRPQRYGERLWVCPTHERVDADGAVVIRLDPGLAFGTGTHPTTRLCLEWLDAGATSGEIAGTSVVDYGCGSGILAIAALKLGARHAAAFDIDPQALIATADNAAANECGAALQVVADGLRLPRTADLLLANILSGPLCELAPRFADLVRPGGQLVLAGLLVEQMDEVRSASAPWFDLLEWRRLDGWSCLAGRRNAALSSQ
jgi:ribosomal protein L11 methyltransferase